MSKMNLKKMTMAFTATAMPETQTEEATSITPPIGSRPAVKAPSKANVVSQKIAELKAKVKAAGVPETSPKAPVVKVPKVVVEGDEKTFTVAGTSIRKGEMKMRFANDLVTRVKILEKDKHTEINLVELPNPMTKAEIVTYFTNHPELGINGVALDNKNVAMASRSKKQAVTEV